MKVSFALLLLALAVPDISAATTLSIDDFIGRYRGEKKNSCPADLTLTRRGAGIISAAPGRLVYQYMYYLHGRRFGPLTGAFTLEDKRTQTSIDHTYLTADALVSETSNLMSVPPFTYWKRWLIKLRMSDGGKSLVWSHTSWDESDGKKSSVHELRCSLQRE